MSYFDTDPRSSFDLLEHARQNPARIPDPGWTEGAASSTFKGLIQGTIAQPALLLGDAATPLLRPTARAIDDLFGGTTANDWLTGEQQKTIASVRALMPDESTGLLGQLGYGLTSTLPGAAVGTILGGPAGGSAAAGGLAGYSSFRVAQDRGVDDLTALGQGAIEGATMAAGVALPVSIGSSVAKSVAVGVGGNVGLGVASRGAIGELLSSNGYAEMAKQYQAFDETSIITDAVLGAAFGVIGAKTAARPEVPLAAVDGALAAKAKQHVEVEVAPGVPVEPAGRTAHAKAVEKAMNDLANDRPVDVSTTGVLDAEFLSTRRELESTVQKVVEDLAPLGRVLNEVDTLRAQLREMGLEAPDEPLFSGQQQANSAWYSGAPAGLTELDPSLARAGNRYGRGVYLGTDAGFTETYSRGALDSTGARGEGGATYEATFNPVKPFNADAVMTRSDAEKVLKDAGADAAQIKELLGAKPKVGGSTVFDALTKLKGNRDGASEALVAQGYDAVLFKDNRGAQLAVSYGRVPVRETVAKTQQTPREVVKQVFGEQAELSLVDDSAQMDSLATAARNVDSARAEMEVGTLPERDVTPQLEAALELVPIVRERSVDSVVEGTDLYTQPAGPESIALLRAAESGKPLGEVMDRYTDSIRKQGNPQFADTFDVPPPSRAEFLRAAIEGKPVRQDKEAAAVVERDSGELELEPMVKTAEPLSPADAEGTAQVLESTPNAQTLDDNGQMRVAAVALSEADATIKQAESDSAAFPAAVSCFLRG